MAVRARYRIESSISSSDAELKDLGKLLQEVVTDGYNEGGIRKFTLDAGATNVVINTGNVTSAGYLQIRTTSPDPTVALGPITMLLNGGAEPLTIQPMPLSKEAHFLISTDSITALTMSNPGADDIEVTLVVAGD